MQKHPDLTKARIHRTLYRRIKPLAYPRRKELETLEAWAVGGEPVSYAEAVRQKFEPFEVGRKWGGSWDTVWFRITAAIPEDWAGEQVVARLRLGGLGREGFTVEGLVWQDGVPVCAINQNRSDVQLSTSARAGSVHRFFLESGANGLAAKLKGDVSESPAYELPPAYTFESAEMAVFDEDAWRLGCEWQCLWEVLDILPADTPRHGQLLAGMNEAVNLLERGGSTAELRSHLAEFLKQRNGDSVHQISAIGHAHIDTAWLWPLRESIRKCARSFRSTLNYMEAYPDYVFGCSQPVHYSWMKHYYPSIYEDIKKAIKRGQWEPLGAMWVEPDCNIPSGEALVRQIHHGKLFFREELGMDIRNVWIPDVFGYSASMPQIMKQAGLDYFLTQKISWNQFNRFTHHSFLWQGIDGTRVFTHFLPSDTYNSDFSPKEILESQRKFKDHDRATRSLYAYGYGDGGGGPTPQMLENARCLKNLEGMPQVRLEKAQDFFEKAQAELNDPSIWVGELYLEYHRGTYTTQAATKRGNRKGEIALAEAEFVDALAWKIGEETGRDDPDSLVSHAPERAVYDTFEYTGAASRNGRAPLLDRAWKLLLLNQFHDILPGSSIKWVYEDAARDYADIQKICELVYDDAVRSLMAGIGTGDTKDPLLAVNSSAVPFQGVVDTDKTTPLWIEAPAVGYALQSATSAKRLPDGIAPVASRAEEDGYVLENDHLFVQIDNKGHLCRVVDKDNGREVLAEGASGNVLQVHPDYPIAHEAWDVDIYYKDNCEDLEALEIMEVEETGGLRGSVVIERRLGNSRIRQSVRLSAGSRRLDFVTEVDWQERKTFLKAAFPVRIHNDKACFEIQYGHLERATHANTSWDMARFEVCAQRWADLSEGDYGVALLNDCKYGYDVSGNVLRLSLLRGPEHPDPDADKGRHTFTYSLFPHAGDLRSGGVIEEATRLNQPPRLHSLPNGQKGSLPRRQSWVQADRPGFYLTACKLAERKDAVVIRGYEGWGTRGPMTIQLAFPVKQVWLANLLEEPVEEIAHEEGWLTVQVRPFEILTLLLITEN